MADRLPTPVPLRKNFFCSKITAMPEIEVIKNEVTTGPYTEGDTITYEVISVDETYMTVHINFGGGVWAFRFINSTALGIDDVNPVSSFNFFPNPVNDVLTIKAQASIDSITVYNMLGQAVVRSTPNTTDSTVDMSALQTGAYFVQVSINNTLNTVRVIKN